MSYPSGFFQPTGSQAVQARRPLPLFTEGGPLEGQKKGRCLGLTLGILEPFGGLMWMSLYSTLEYPLMSEVSSSHPIGPVAILPQIIAQRLILVRKCLALAEAYDLLSLAFQLAHSS